MQNKYLRGQIAALRGTRNPHVQPRTFRFLRSVRLALYPARLLITRFLNVLLASLLIGVISNSMAFDLGKTLENAAKEKIDSITKTGDKTEAPAPATNETASDTPVFNWKKPSKAEEIALGREITGSILGAAPLVNDAALQKYVNEVGRWVASQSERADLPWHFGVIDSADLNAFAAPGGYVLITKGLYQKLQNEAQLAGVLGHEIAHVVKKHQLKVLQKQQLLSAGANILGDQLGQKDELAKKAISNGAEISARSLDKEAEFEADRMGMVLATRAGYDPFGLPEVLETIAQTNSSDNSVALLYKTHPHPDERLLKLSDAVGSKLDNAKAGKTLEKRFYRLD